MGGLRLIATFGWLLGSGALAAWLAGMVALAGEEEVAGTFFATAAATAFIAAGLVFAFRGRGAEPHRRHGLALILALWLVWPAFAAVPIIAIAGTTPIAGYFEAVSAFTTTGATALGPIDALPRALVFWRAILEWLGGGLTILLAAAALDVGRSSGEWGVHLLSASVANAPRLAAIARTVLPTYGAVTALCFAALTVAGIPGFDAACLALSTVSTGGAMPRDGDISDYGVPAAVPILCIFMTAGAVSFVALRQLMTRGARASIDSARLARLAAAAGLLACVIAAILARDVGARGGTYVDALVEGVFTTVSLLSTTAFVHNTEIAAGLPLALLTAVVLVGGTYGSTAGGLKIDRVGRMLEATGRELDTLVHPSSIAGGGRSRHASGEPQRVLWSYLIAYLMAAVVVAMILAGSGLGFAPALLGAAGAISNAGPVLDFLPVPGGAVRIHASLPDGAKGALALAMILGRVEILAVLSLLTPLFWRR